MAVNPIRGFISRSLRKAWVYYAPERKQALENAKIRTPIKKKDGSNGGSFNTFIKCAKCDQLFNQSEIEVDHIEPVGKLFDWPPNESFLKWLRRLFCDVDNLQCLCKNCHKDKSRQEKSSGKYKEIK